MAHIDKDTLVKLASGGMLEPYIKYIRFPRFRNLADDLKIDFQYPITALVGTNGTNKSSILRAIQGCPGNNNLGMYWFSTSIDPIDETGDKPNCFIYAYYHIGSKKLVEVLKTRVFNNENEDYWEPSRAIRAYGMQAFDKTQPAQNKNKTRWDAINKDVVYLDFRQALSAYDKYFYNSDSRRAGTLRERKSIIRRRATHLKAAISQKLKTYNLYQVERIVGAINKDLSKEEVEAISRILGREYTKISWVNHDFFNNQSFTCVMRTGSLSYTEAFAGSGEFAIVRLVTDLMNAPEKSLILLDEPEVSLHPGAQNRLVDFLHERVKKAKYQVVMSTHSPAMLRALPPSAIKVLVQNPTTGRVELPRQEAAPSEAFFHIGEPISGRRTIVVEDALAAEITLKALRLGGESFVRLFDVKFYPGGSKVLWQYYAQPYAAEGRQDVVLLFDADERPDEPFRSTSEIPASQESLVKEEILRVTGIDLPFPVDGGMLGANEEQRRVMRRKFIDWARRHVMYLPGDIKPEAFVWDKMKTDSMTEEVASAHTDAKKRFDMLTRKEMGRDDYETLESRDILGTQTRRLATISADDPDIQDLYKSIRDFPWLNT